MRRNDEMSVEMPAPESTVDLNEGMIQPIQVVDPDHPTGKVRYHSKMPSYRARTDPSNLQIVPTDYHNRHDSSSPEDIPLPEPGEFDEDPHNPHHKDSQNPDSELTPRNRLKEQEEKSLFQHVLNGHATYHPACESCRLSRGVTRHVSRKLGELEIQADFAIIQGFKILVLVEKESGAVGFVFVSQNHEGVIREIERWVTSVGLAGPSSACILVRSDLEPALVSLLKKSIPGRVETVPPEAHEQVGSAERGVRLLKERMSCLRYEIQQQGCDFPLTDECLPLLCRYIATTHNLHHKIRGGDKTAIELITGSSRTSFMTAPFGSVCFAETPQSVETSADTRWIPAAFIGPQYGGRSVLVSSVVGPIDNQEVKIFQAKSIKVLNRIIYEPKYAPSLLIKIDKPAAPDGGVSRIPSADSQPAHVIPAPMPKSGPPIQWIREHGRTKGCYACNNPKGVSHGRVHSRSCKDRYIKWVKEQPGHRPDVSKAPSLGPVDQEGAAKIRDPLSLRSEDQESRPDVYYVPIRQPPGSAERPSQPSKDSQPVDVQSPNDNFDYVPSEIGDDPMDIDLNDMEKEDVDMVGMIVNKLCAYEDVFNAGPFSLVSHHEKPEDLECESQLLCPLLLPKIGQPTEFTKYNLGGSDVHLATPIASRAETGEPLDLQDTITARKVELDSLNKVNFGKVCDRATAEKYAAENGIKIIGTRWIVTPKVIEHRDAVRCRLVVQEVASGAPSAASLGLSSSTPSMEAVRCMLALAAQERLFVDALDCSTAFMHSPLPRGQKAVVRLPGDVSSKSNVHEPSFAILTNALNGLRSASLAWLEMARRTLRKIGLKSSPTETTVFAGMVPMNGRNYKTNVLIYVDDILVTSQGEKVHELVLETLLTVVHKVKHTGSVHATKGGSLTFLGKEITREAGSDVIQTRVPPVYLQEVIEHLTPTEVPPDILKEIEKEVDSSPVLEAAEATKYRSVLGRVAWWLQSRPDLARFGSLLAQGQKDPKLVHMNCLTKFLRFVKSQLHFYQVFPSPNLRNFTGVDYSKIDEHSLILFADASWGSQESTQRRSCSGYVIIYKDCVLKACSRLQTSVALSSCESETVALLQASQEACGVRQLVEFLRGSGKDIADIGGLSLIDIESFEMEGPPVVLVTDSSSARDVLLGDGLSRRTRHLSIAVYFLQSLIKHQTFRILWTPGVLQVADTLTKILPKATLINIRDALGYCEVSIPEVWQNKSVKPGQLKPFLQGVLAKYTDQSEIRQRFADAIAFLRAKPHGRLIIELCTAQQSGFAQHHGSHIGGCQFFVIQITKEDDLLKSREKIIQQMKILESVIHDRPTTVYVSPPCTGGSPAQNLKPDPERIEKHWMYFKALLRAANPILAKAQIRMLELSRSCTYWKTREVQRFLQRHDLIATSFFDRCAYSKSESVNPSGQIFAKHTYRCQSNISLEPRLRCTCEKHVGFGQQNLQALGSYPKSMVRDILAGVAKERNSRGN